MKRFQRVSAFLMALALMVSLLPAGVFSIRSAATEEAPAVEVGKTYLHAVYQASGVTFDGAPDYTYPLNVTLSDSVMLGAAWDATYLYLSVNSAAELAELKLNDVDITEKQVTAAAGEDPGYAEYRIALMDADVPSLDVGVNTLTVKLSESDTAQTVYLIFDNNAYNRYELAVDGPLVSLVEGNPYAANVKGETSGNSYVTANNSSLVPSLDAPVIVEMDIDINSLIDNYDLADQVNTNVRWVTMGAGVQVMDELVALSSGKPTEAFLFGFTHDKNSGNLYFQSAVSTGAGSFTSSDVLISETVDGLYHVRVEYTYAPDTNGELSHDSVVSAKYFVNGKLIDEQSNVRVSKTGKTMVGSTKGIRLYSSKNENDYTVSNISISGNAPAALAALKAAYVAGRQGPDQAAAALVATQINNLPAVSQLALTDQAAVEAARAAYEDLTPAQKAYVEETTLNTLAAAEAKIASLFVQSRNDYLFADAVGGIVLDGQIESSYRLNIPFTPTTRMGAVWDLTNLYLAITGDDLGEMTAVAVDGKPLTAVKGAGGNEYAIPVGVLDLQGDKAYTLTFTLGDLIWNGTLVLGTNDYTTINIGASAGSTVDATNRVAYLDSSIPSNGLAVASVKSYRLEGLANTSTIFEFDVQVNAMPDTGRLNGKGRGFCQGGLGITFRDQDPSVVEGTSNLCEAFMIGLFKENGVMKLGYWDNTVGGYVTVDAGETVDGQYHVRVEFVYPEDVLSNDIAANYYINGKLAATAASAKQSGGSKGTGQTLGMQICAYRYSNVDVDAVVSNVSVSHPKGVDAVAKDLAAVVTAPQTNILLQPGANKSEMNFTWFSQSQEQGVIKYAKESELVGGELPENAASVTATRGDYDKKAGYVNNKATITGLKPDTTYYYQLINGNDKTELKSFKTGADGDFSFAFVGDPQIGGSGDNDRLSSDLITQHLKAEAEWWGMTLDQIKNEGVDFIMSAGDQTDTHAYNYWDKTDVTGIYGIHEQQFDAFANQNVLLGLPIVTVTGNHDDDTYPVYADHVNVPNMLKKEDGTYYGATYTGGTNFTGADYYFTYNNVLFLVLNANTYYHDRTNSDEHLDFIDRVINEETAGQNFDWIITLYHESPYGSSYHQDEDRGEQDSYARIRSHLVPKLYEAGVDLVLSGHDHCYTRTHILKPGVDNGGDSYVIQSDAYNAWKNDVPIGAANVDGMLHVVGGTGSGSQVNAVKYNTEDYKVATATANTRMMTKIEVTGDTLTLITYNMGTGLSNNPVEIDRIAITNDADAAVEAAIDAIGNVTLKSEQAINDAREAYDALSPQLKKRVANYQTLVDAEAAFEALPEEDHTMTPVAGKEATCGEDGYAAYQWCAHCETYFTVEGAEIPDIEAWKTGEGKLSATGDHNYVGDVCTNCGEGNPNYVIIDEQPKDQEAAIGANAYFSVAVNNENVTYQWYYLKAGTTNWIETELPGCKTNTLTVEVKDYREGLQFKCVITNAIGESIESEAATLTVQSGEIVINSQPANVNNAVLGQPSSFTVDAVTAGGEDISYQWYVYNVSKGAWERSYLEGYNTATLTVSVTRFRVGLQYKCVITSGLNEVETDVVTLNMQEIIIVNQTTEFAGNVGDEAVLSVEATGNGLTYQWYFSNDGEVWKLSGLTGCKTEELTVKMLAYRVGQIYRCKITDVNGQVSWSEPVTLTVASAQ